MNERYKINVNVAQARYLFKMIIENLPTTNYLMQREMVQVLDELRSAIEILEEQEELRK